MLTPLLAHAGGFSWDEALLVLAPLLVIGAILVALNRRASQWEDGDDDATADEESRIGPGEAT